MPDKLITSVAISKLLGGFGGNLIAQSILKPKTFMEFLRRAVSSLLLAYTMTVPIMNWFELPINGETIMAAATGVGLFGWFLVSILLHTLNSAKTVKELKDNIK